MTPHVDVISAVLTVIGLIAIIVAFALGAIWWVLGFGIATYFAADRLRSTL